MLSLPACMMGGGQRDRTSGFVAKGGGTRKERGGQLDGVEKPSEEASGTGQGAGQRTPHGQASAMIGDLWRTAAGDDRRRPPAAGQREAEP